MHRFWKLTTVILSTSVVIGGISSILTNGLLQGNAFQIPISKSNTTQVLSTELTNTAKDLKYYSNYNSTSMFAVAKDATNGDRLYAWGGNNDGQLGLVDKISRRIPTIVPELSGKGTITNIAIGSNFTLVVLNGKELWSVGKNTYGQLGNRTNDDSTIFTKTSTFPENITSISAGGEFAALITGGQVNIWGRNSNSQLGDGTQDDRNYPLEVYFPDAVNPGEVQCGEAFIVVSHIFDNAIESLYTWGKNDDGQLGLGNTYERSSPALMPSTVSDKVSKFFVGKDYLFTTNYNKFDSTKQYRVFVNGLNTNSNLGVPSKLYPVEVPTAPNEEIVKISISTYSTALLTSSKSLYLNGIKNNGSSAPGTDNFVKLGLTGINDVYLSSEASMAINTVGVIYGWGNNATGVYGNNSIDSQDAPATIDPFATISALGQETKDVTNISTATAIAQMYPGGVLDNTVFKQYVDVSKFPKGTIFTKKTTPTSNRDGEISLTVTADRRYASPDSAYSLGVADFSITLSSFKTDISDSSIVLIAPRPPLYNLRNIVDKIAPGGTVDDVVLGQLIDLTKFPIGTKFNISGATTTLDADKLTGKYTATLGFDKSYKTWGVSKIAGTFSLEISNLDAVVDSVITLNPIDHTKYNLNNIKKALEPNDNGVLDDTHFKKIFTTAYFTSTNKFTIKDAKITGTTYSATIVATEAFDGGNIIAKDFPVTINDLKPRPDSAIILKSLSGTNLNLNNIISLIGNGSTPENLLVIGRLFEISEFPPNTTFEVANPKIDRATKLFTASILPTHCYIGGNPVVNTSVFSLSVPMEVQDDSTIVFDTIPAHINLNNIMKLINPHTDYIDFDILDSLFNFNNFPMGNTFTLSSADITGDTYTAVLKSNKSYYGGDVVGNQIFTITVPRLKERPDSTIQYLIPPANINLNNINTLLGDGTSTSNVTTLGTLIDLTMFPSDTTYLLKNQNNPLIDGYYSASLIVSNYFAEGNPQLKSNDYVIRIENLPLLPSSKIIIKDIPADINLNNISSKLGDCSTTENLYNLGRIIGLSVFPSNTTYSIDNVNNPVEDGFYRARLIASKYIDNGIEKNEEKTFSMLIHGLQPRPNTELVILSPIASELTKLMESAKPGTTIDKSLLSSVFDLKQFPDNATFMISEELVHNTETNKLTIKFVPSHVYENGNVVINTKAYTVEVNYTPIEANTDLIWILGINGGVIVLIAILLVIWYRVQKRRNAFPDA